MKQQKPHLNVVVIGHLKSGKSSAAGHLLYECGAINKTTRERIKLFEIGLTKYSCSFDFILDSLRLERERAVTVDAAISSFESEKFQFTITDVPGHRDFIKNTIRGTYQADVAILMTSAVDHEFEGGICSEGETREHISLAYTFGVKQMIVCINKMDHKTVNWSETRYLEIKKKLGDYLRKVGYNPENIPFVPISGWTGQNLVNRNVENIISTKTITNDSHKFGSWYTGPTLIEALDNITLPKRPTEKPLRIPVRDVYKISGVGTVVVGKVTTGTLKPNNLLSFALSGVTAEVRSIQMYNKDISEALPGYNVGIHVTGVSSAEVKPGDVCGNRNNDPPQSASEFIAQIIVINHPNGIKKGYTPVVQCHFSHVSCIFEELISKVDKKTGTVLESNPQSLKNGEAALVRMVPMKPLCVETFSEYPPLGRFVVRDLNKIVAVGVIKSVTKKTVTACKQESNPSKAVVNRKKNLY